MLEYIAVKGNFGEPMDFIAKGREATNGFFQAVSPRCVLGKRHLQVAIDHVERRISAKDLRSRDEGLELLMALAATHQIGVALDACELTTAEDSAVLVFPDDFDIGKFVEENSMVKDDSLMDVTGKDTSFLDIPDQENITDWAVEAVNLSQL